MQTTETSGLFFASDIFGFWRWVTWFMPFLDDDDDEKEEKKVPFLESEICLNKAVYTQMVLSGSFMPFEGSERDITRYFAWIPEDKAPYRPFVPEYPLLPLAYTCEPFYETAAENIVIFTENFHGLEAGLIAALGLSVEEWIAGNYQAHLCKAIEQDKLALQAIECMKLLNARQIKGLCSRIVQHFLH